MRGRRKAGTWGGGGLAALWEVSGGTKATAPAALLVDGGGGGPPFPPQHIIHTVAPWPWVGAPASREQPRCGGTAAATGRRGRGDKGGKGGEVGGGGVRRGGDAQPPPSARAGSHVRTPPPHSNSIPPPRARLRPLSLTVRHTAATTATIPLPLRVGKKGEGRGGQGRGGRGEGRRRDHFFFSFLAQITAATSPPRCGDHGTAARYVTGGWAASLGPRAASEKNIDAPCARATRSALSLQSRRARAAGRT